MLSETSIIIVTLVAAMIAAVAQYLFKSAMPKFRFNLHDILGLLKNRSILLGLLIYLASLGLYLVALDSGQLSFVYPLFSSTFVFIMLISYLVFKERIGWGRWAGVLLIILGISLISLSY